MFLVMGITGKVGGAAAQHLLAQGKEVRALVRDRDKASSWANRGVELVDGDWNDAASAYRDPGRQRQQQGREHDHRADFQEGPEAHVLALAAQHVEP